MTALRRSAPPEPEEAQGRLAHGPPIAVIDIGSNSVRVVIYEGLARSPTPIFNEKVLAGLGREVQSTGLLNAEAVYYAVRKGDTLYSIARAHNLTVDELRDLNDLTARTKLHAGQKLRVNAPRTLTAGE